MENSFSAMLGSITRQSQYYPDIRLELTKITAAGRDETSIV
jgi:hypothetical protein